MRPLSWDLISSAMAVVEHGSFSAAARALGVTQPTVRRHVDELEAALATPLFTRSSAGLAPTTAMIEIAPFGRDIAALVAALMRSAADDAGSPSGTVRVTASEVMASEVLPHAFQSLLARHPQLDIELVASNRNEDLLRRDADIAVRMVRPTQTGLVARRIGEVHLGLFASRRYLAETGEPATWDDLVARCRVIGEDRRTTLIEALQSRGVDVTARTFGLRSDSDVVQLAAVRSGLGVGICQLPVAARDADLRRVLPDIGATLELWIATHEDLRNQHRIRVVLDQLERELKRFIAAPAS